MEIEEWLNGLKHENAVIINSKEVVILQICGSYHLLCNLSDPLFNLEGFQNKIVKFIIEAINEKLENDKIKKESWDKLKSRLFSEKNIIAQENYNYKLGRVAMKFLEYSQKTGNTKSKSFECSDYGTCMLILTDDYSINVKCTNTTIYISDLSLKELDIVLNNI